MKKLTSIALIALFTISSFAQTPERKQQRPDFTVDQLAELQTKKMTLHLDLTEQQQQEVLAINKREVADRKQKMEARKAARQGDKKPTSDEIFNRKSAQLDRMIAHKAELKKVLTKEQFETWEKSRKRKERQLKKKGKNGKMSQRKR